MFEPINKRRSAVDLCTDAIRDAILAGRFNIGDRLPPERALADMFDLNRLTIRGALSRLTAEGLLTVRQGSGYRIEDFHRTTGPSVLSSLLGLAKENAARTSMIEDLLTLRRHLARAALAKIAEQPNPDHLKRIETCLRAFEDAVARNESLEVIARCDLDIIDAVLSATDSPVYRVCINPIMVVITSWPALRDAMYRDPTSNVAGYRMLRFWLQNPEPQVIDTMIDELAQRDEGTVRFLERPRASS